jgi:hypothetical protein
MKKVAYLAFPFSILFFFGQMSIAIDVACSAKSGPAGWRTFVDRTHRFCFQYPAVYKTIRDPSEPLSRCRPKARYMFGWINGSSWDSLMTYADLVIHPSQLKSTALPSTMTVPGVRLRRRLPLHPAGQNTAY